MLFSCISCYTCAFYAYCCKKNMNNDWKCSDGSVPLETELNDVLSTLSTVKVSIIGWWACQSKVSPIILMRQMWVSDTHGPKELFSLRRAIKTVLGPGRQLVGLHEMPCYQPRVTWDVISKVFAYLNSLVWAVMPKLTWTRWNMDLGLAVHMELTFVNV